MTNANPGDKFTFVLDRMGVSAGGVSANVSGYKNAPMIRLHNDTCMGFVLTTHMEGHSIYVPQGAWLTFALQPGESALDIRCLNQTTPVPAVCACQFTYYFPGEPLDDVGVHGNAPQNIGGVISTSSVQTLSNENSTLATKIIDIGTLTNNDLLDIFNDHFLWKVQQSGVSHQVLAGNTSGSPLQLGQASDITEVLGSLLIDKFLSIISGNNGFINGQTSGTVTMYQPLRGDVKLVYFAFSNYKNTATQSLSPPVAFTGKSFVFTGDTGSGHLDFKLSGVAVNLNVVSAIAAAGGSATGQAFIGQYSIGQIGITTSEGAFDTIDFQVNTSAANGFVLIIGV